MPGAGKFRQPAFGGGAAGKAADHEPVAVVILAPEFKYGFVPVHSVSPIGAGAQAGAFPLDPHKDRAAIEEGKTPVEVAAKSWPADLGKCTIGGAE